jgi:hypothetical protein
VDNHAQPSALPLCAPLLLLNVLRELAELQVPPEAAHNNNAAVERSGLWTLDCEIWRLHYAETLRLWRQALVLQRSCSGTFDPMYSLRLWVEVSKPFASPGSTL